MLDLTRITLDEGGHGSREEGVCLMEAVAWWAGEEHTDQPECVSPGLAAMGRNLNDALPDDARQRLLPLVPLMAGTAGDGLDEARRYMALDWMVRTYIQTWLDLAGLTDHADALRSLAPVVDPRTRQDAYRVVRKAIERAGDKWAQITVGVAECDTVHAAVRTAAWEVADSSAWRLAQAAVWNSAWDSAWNSAWTATQDSVWIAAWSAARDAARSAGGPSLVEVTDAVRTYIASTVASLQDSAIQLLHAMIRPDADARHGKRLS